MADDIIQIKVGSRNFRALSTGFVALQKQLDKSLDRTAPRIQRAMLEALDRVAARMRARHGSPWSGINPDSPDLHVRSGKGLQGLLDSIRTTKSNRLDRVRGSMTLKGFMVIHETGGVVRPASADYMTIPLPAAMDGRGNKLRKRARSWPNTFVRRSRQGNLLIFQRRGRDIVPLYVLKKSVRIPPRLGLQESISNDAIPYFERRVADIIADEVSLDG